MTASMYRLVPYTSCFHYAIQPAIWLYFTQEKGLIMAERCICQCATKTGRGIVFPGRCPQVTTGINVEILHDKRNLIWEGKLLPTRQDSSKPAFFLVDQWVTKPAYSLIQPSVVLRALRPGLPGQTGILCCCLCWTVARLLTEAMLLMLSLHQRCQQ